MLIYVKLITKKRKEELSENPPLRSDQVVLRAVNHEDDPVLITQWL